MSEQQFQRGDVVRVADDLGSFMSHFRAGADAVVMGSYADQYGGSDHDSYTLMFCDNGSEVSWYYGAQLTLIRHGEEQDIQRIKAETEAREVHERDLAWIATHWTEIRNKVPGASAEELMRRVGIANPWGSHGEGMAWYANWQQTFEALDPILSDMPPDPESAIAHVRLTQINVRVG